MLNLQEYLKNSFIYRLNLDYKNVDPFLIARRARDLSGNYDEITYAIYNNRTDESKSSYVFNLNIKNISREIYFYNDFLNNSTKEIDLIFGELKSEINNLSKTIIESEEKLFKNRRMVIQNIPKSERIALFEESDFEDFNNFKDPKNNKYFDNRSLCNNRHNLLKLPLKQSVNVSYEFIEVDQNKSSKGIIKRSLNNLEQDNDSFQYLAKTKSNEGATLCLKLRFFHKELINEIVFKDTSLNPIFIDKIENEAGVILPFKSIQRGIKDIVHFETKQKVNILYIYFNQNKAIEYGVERNSLYREIIENSYINEKLFLHKDKEKKYMYEFSIDNIEVYRNSYKKEGIFRYSKTIKTNSLNKIEIKTNYYINSNTVDAEYYAEIKSYENEQSFTEGIVKKVQLLDLSSTNTISDALEIQEVRLILILRSNNNDIYVTDFIKSIDIDLLESTIIRIG